jgi:PhnB protein
MLGPGGKIMHTEIRIGDSVVMLNDPAPEMGSHPTTSSMYLYVDDCDALHRRAVAAGAKSTFEPTDCFWGDRMSQVVDKWGNKWSISTRVKEMSADEQRKAGEEFMKQQMAPKS